MSPRALISLLALVHAACAPAARPSAGPDVGALFGPTASPAETGTLPAPPDKPSPDPGAPPAAQPPCQSDTDCGYDPTSGQCGADPRWNNSQLPDELLQRRLRDERRRLLPVDLHLPLVPVQAPSG